MRITGEMGNLAAWEKRLFYMCSARPTLHPRALFSDVTSDYRSPAEPVPGDEVTIRLRTGRYNVDKAYLVVDNVEHVMTRVRSESMFDYYEAKINVGTDKIYYYFKVELGRTVCYYNQIGAIKDLNPYYNFQITPGFKTPEWAKGAVMYQIFVDRFYNGDKSNDVLDDEYNYIGEHVCQVKDWNKYPAQMGIREFYGGDLKGVLDKLDYLEGLGIEVIYFNPLFVSPSIISMIYRITIILTHILELLSMMRVKCLKKVTRIIPMLQDILTELQENQTLKPAMNFLQRLCRRFMQEA
nr:alpha amylase N-terminal ig-like domain-containing protein [Lachnospira eligens]